MLYSLLTDTGSSTTGGSNGGWLTYVLLGVLVVAIIAMLIVSSRRNKKRQQEAENLINAVKPGNKVKTIGGICGIVVEVDEEENTFVLETGSEASGKSYMKFDRQAIYQTDAVVETPAKGKKGEEEESSEQSAEAPAEEAAQPAGEAVQTEETQPAGTGDKE